MHRKPLRDLTSTDIENLVGEQEGPNVEFKASLSAKAGVDDPWIRGENRIGDHAKRDLVKELVAFANTDGGTLVLGVEEDGEKRASRIAPIRDCRELADRLGASCLAGIDPPLTSMDAVGVEIDGAAGVVVFRVSSSHLAPHRAKDGMECYHRLGDRSVPMSMLQVRDLSVGRVAGIRDISRILEERAHKLSFPTHNGMHLLNNLGNTYQYNIGVRASAYPLDRVVTGEVLSAPEWRIATPDIAVGVGVQRLKVPFSFQDTWQPILRGLQQRTHRQSNGSTIARVIRADGLIEFTLVCPEIFFGSGERGVPCQYLLWPLAQLLIAVECTRRILRRPELAFALDFEWRFPFSVPLLGPEDYGRTFIARSVEPNNRVTDYEMPSSDRLNGFWRTLQKDVYSSFGLADEHVADLDFKSAVEAALATSIRRNSQM